MSNIAGKAYAMNLLTPIERHTAVINRIIFWLVGTFLFKHKLRGLLTLSVIHYARWVIIKDSDFPRLDPNQPREQLTYRYMLFMSNFNGSWAQYVDSFSTAIPSGLNLLWRRNVKWPQSVPELPFHRYVNFNSILTNYYYNAYPAAAANDVKAAKNVKDSLTKFVSKTEGASAQEFEQQYQYLVLELQQDLSQMAPTPIVSLAVEAVAKRREQHT